MSEENVEFVPFKKIPRLNRGCVITEKIDGTNAQIYITESNEIYAGSRNRWLTLENDNFGFARWVQDNKLELLKLGQGRHFGEWWGSGIQRRYGISEKRFSLFNTSRWNQNDPEMPSCVGVVPVIYSGDFTTDAVTRACDLLRSDGSIAAPGFMDAEGVVVYMIASGTYHKVTLKNDEMPKVLVK